MVLARDYRCKDAARRKHTNVAVRKKKKRINVAKIGAVTLGTIIAVSAGYAIYSHLPFVKVNKAIAAGNRYSASADYEAAISSYNAAIELDASSVEAYNNMAGAYLSIDDSESAKKVLYDGWQNTENENLLNNYLTVILNDAVNEMNLGQGNVDTVLSVIPVLEEDGSNKEALQILDAAYARCFTSYSENADKFFRSTDNGACTYDKYEEIIERLLSVYETAPSDELALIIEKYAVPLTDSFTIGSEDAARFGALLERVSSEVGSTDEIDSLRACFTNAKEVQAVFADIFDQLDVGNVDELRDFVVSEEYIALRNIFLHGEETPLENTTYIPVSREAMILNLNEGNWSYRFLSFEEYPETSGVITIWANYFEDDGVQRNSISYEPGPINGNIFPHTKYSVTYLKSYITQGNSTKVAQMNYRLSTLITDEDGNMTETVVGDWGGANEWTMDIETIESRIRA